MREFLLESYDYHLPQELIAKYPIFPKESAKLLVYDKKSQKISHTNFFHLFDFIPRDALLVFNDTKVLKARVYGNKRSGARIEIFFHKELKNGIFLVQMRGKVKQNDRILISPDYEVEVVALRDNGFREVIFYHQQSQLNSFDVYKMLKEVGHIPLPPYIKRDDDVSDEKEYQSVFARHYGAVAAPTASLHFSENMMSFIEENYQSLFLTLHVGAGTFMSVESKDIRDHQIHSEILVASKEKIKKLKEASKVCCIGTTAMRSVEFLARRDMEEDFSGECDIFLNLANLPIKTQLLLTNFHLPKSTLLMLVSAMVGLDECHRIYQEAIRKKYRFYSYGDGMLIL